MIHDAPIGWLVSDLIYDGYVDKEEVLLLETVNYSQLFKLQNHRYGEILRIREPEIFTYAYDSIL